MKDQLQGLVLGALLILAATGGAEFANAQTGTVGKFPDVARIETDLKVDVSTKMDVQRLLGTPSGYGEMIMPGTNAVLEVWFYGDSEATDVSSSGGVYHMEGRQQMLLVFFAGTKFNGFMWTSDQISGGGE